MEERFHPTRTNTHKWQGTESKEAATLVDSVNRVALLRDAQGRVHWRGENKGYGDWLVSSWLSRLQSSPNPRDQLLGRVLSGGRIQLGRLNEQLSSQAQWHLFMKDVKQMDRIVAGLYQLASSSSYALTSLLETLYKQQRPGAGAHEERYQRAVRALEELSLLEVWNDIARVYRSTLRCLTCVVSSSDKYACEHGRAFLPGVSAGPNPQHRRRPEPALLPCTVLWIPLPSCHSAPCLDVVYHWHVGPNLRSALCSIHVHGFPASEPRLLHANKESRCFHAARPLHQHHLSRILEYQGQ